MAVDPCLAYLSVPHDKKAPVESCEVEKINIPEPTEQDLKWAETMIKHARKGVTALTTKRPYRHH
jgi:hypothetical protein